MFRVLGNPKRTCASISQRDLLVAGDFGLVTSGKSKSDLLLDFGRFLIARHQQQLTTVLVVDEAHHLSAEVLEEIRLLTNLETAQEKLLQILLIGQPELDEKLDLPELRQLKQRIALRARLEALDWEETCGYVKRRLQTAGAMPDSALFPDETIGEIYRHSLPHAPSLYTGVHRERESVHFNSVTARYTASCTCSCDFDASITR